MKKPTMRDVAALAGVSSATVSRVLSGTRTISKETQEKVRKACENLNYIPDLAARGLSGHLTKTVGLLVPDISNAYFSGIATSIEKKAAENGYKLIISNSLRDIDRELQVIDSLLSQQVDGLIISAYSPESQARHAALLGNVPCIYLGNNHGKNCSFVEADNFLGAYEGAQYLLRLGHRDIWFLGGRQGSRTLTLRLAGFQKAMTENGCTGQIFTAPPLSPRNWVEKTTEALLEKGLRPDAIVSYSDMFAMQILSACERFQLKIPENISLLGFDNIYFSTLPRIHLTSVSQHKATQGRLAFERLMEKIQGDSSMTADILRPELIIRSTCRKAGNGPERPDET